MSFQKITPAVTQSRPSVSPAQKKLMDAVAHGWHKPGNKGPTLGVAQHFVEADKKAGK